MSKYYGKEIKLNGFTIKDLTIEQEFDLDILIEEYEEVIRNLTTLDEKGKKELVPMYKIAKDIYKNNKDLNDDIIAFCDNIDELKEEPLFRKLTRFYDLYLQFVTYRYKLKKK